MLKKNSEKKKTAIFKTARTCEGRHKRDFQRKAMSIYSWKLLVREHQLNSSTQDIERREVTSFHLVSASNRQWYLVECSQAFHFVFTLSLFYCNSVDGKNTVVSGEYTE